MNKVVKLEILGKDSEETPQLFTKKKYIKDDMNATELNTVGRTQKCRSMVISSN